MGEEPGRAWAQRRALLSCTPPASSSPSLEFVFLVPLFSKSSREFEPFVELFYVKLELGT